MVLTAALTIMPTDLLHDLWTAPCEHLNLIEMPSTIAEALAHTFAAALAPSQRLELEALRTNARQTPPADCVTLHCGALTLGQLLPDHACALASVLPHCALKKNALLWNAAHETPAHRSAQLQIALLHLRDQGYVQGWRDEAFCFWPDANPDTQQQAFLQIERAGFRFLGMMSHAVHINGFTSDGRLWCGQRSASKATDPGMWDNMTAGGLAAGESLSDCAKRELWEEAGFRLSAPGHLISAGCIRISRITPRGWHDEMLHVYNLRLPDDFVPSNQDGEVQSFARLSAPEAMARISAQQFTCDAALALAQGLSPATQAP